MTSPKLAKVAVQDPKTSRAGDKSVLNPVTSPNSPEVAVQDPNTSRTQDRDIFNPVTSSRAPNPPTRSSPSEN